MTFRAEPRLPARERITPRQRELLELLADAPQLTVGQAAARLEMAESTARAQLRDAYRRLDVGSLAEAWRALGLLGSRRPR